MKYLFAIWWGLIKPIPGERDAKQTLRQHVRALQKSGYTKKAFDCDGHVIIIQSRKHVEDNSA